MSMQNQCCTPMEKITDSDILYLKTTMAELGVAARSIDDTWKRAFAWYNFANEPNLSLQCSPCYMKVLMYLEANLKNE